MRDVYSGATLVRAWLGCEENDSEEAFRTFHQEREAFYKPSLKAKEEQTTAQMAALQAISDRTYWTRFWIVQELILARKLVIHCGDDKIDWWPEMFPKPMILSFQRTPVWQVFNLKSDKESKKLLLLMKHLYTAKATDFRDRLYALLGIAEDVPPGTIVIDYTASVVDIKKEIMDLCLRDDVQIDRSGVRGYLNRFAVPRQIGDFNLALSGWLDSYFGDITELRHLERGGVAFAAISQSIRNQPGSAELLDTRGDRLLWELQQGSMDRETGNL